VTIFKSWIAERKEELEDDEENEGHVFEELHEVLSEKFCCLRPIEVSTDETSDSYKAVDTL